MIFTAFSNLSKLLFVLHILALMKFLLRWCAPCKLRWTLFKSSFPIFRKLCISDLQRFETFWNCCLFCTFGLLRNFYSGDAHHANYDKHTLNQHFQHSVNCVYQIYSDLKLFEIAICFAHFGFYEISTPVMRTMLTMQNVVYIIISNIPPTVHIRYIAFWNFSKLLFVLNILAVTKFLHRWCASCSQWQTYFKSSFPTLLKLCVRDFQRFQIVWNCSSFPHFEFYEIFTAVICTMLIIVNFV